MWRQINDINLLHSPFSLSLAYMFTLMAQVLVYYIFLDHNVRKFKVEVLIFLPQYLSVYARKGGGGGLAPPKPLLTSFVNSIKLLYAACTCEYGIMH